MAISDQEFIELWEKLRSPKKVADELRIHVRNVFMRRSSIENKYGIKLTVKARDRGDEAGSSSEPFYPHITTRKHPAKHPVNINSGVIIVFSDAHFWPGVRTTAFKALLHCIAELQPDMVVCNGDAFDGSSISRFPRIGWDSKPSVSEEIKACKDRLEEIEDLLKPACKTFWPLGNHDARFETYLAANAPQFEKIDGFSLQDHFPKWIPCWSVWVNEDLVIKHRYKGGIHATHNNTVTSGRSMVTGHLHSLKVTPYTDYNGSRFGVDTGTLADPSGPQFEDYLETNPTNWRSGFAVLTYHKGRLLWPEIAHVLGEGLVEFRGQVIDVTSN